MVSVGRGRVLIVEDAPGTLKVIAGVVQRYGDSAVAKDAATARRHIHGDGLIDAAIVDLGLPDGHGFDLVRDLGAARVRVPALVLTGDRNLDNVDQARALGCACMFKPMSSSELEIYVRNQAGNRFVAAVEHTIRDFSARQKQVFRMTAFGGGSDLGEELGMSSSARGTHRARMAERLGEPIDVRIGRLRRCYFGRSGAYPVATSGRDDVA